MPDLRPGPLTVLARAATRVRTRGPREVGELVAGRVKEFVSSQETLVFLSRPAAQSADAAPSSRWSDLDFVAATADDGSDYARFIGTDSARTFTARLSADTRCFLVRHDGRLVHATWVTTSASWVRELGRYFRVPPQAAYVYESFTRADARGMGVYPFALRQICDRLAGDGVARVWVGVEESNAASLRAVTKAGFEPTLRIAFSRRWGRLRVELSDEARAACPGCLEGTFDS